MPSENELAAEYNTSRKTARSALAVLRSEGLITTGQGRRATVRPRGQVGITVTGSNYRKHRGLGLPGFNAQALEQGQRPRQEIREVTRIPAPSEVAARLDIDEGAEVVVRRLTFLLEGSPIATHDSYFPADLVADTAIEQPQLIRGGAHAVIEDPAGPIHRKSRVRSTRYRAGCQHRRRREYCRCRQAFPSSAYCERSTTARGSLWKCRTLWLLETGIRSALSWT